MPDMPSHTERRVVPYPPEAMFALVTDVARYPEFLPWCQGARVLRRTEAEIEAELTIGYKIVRETFASRVVLEPPRRIDITYLGGPMRHLTNSWAFAPAGQGGCAVDFHIDFAFRNPIFERLAGAVFTRALTRMVAAFEDRARALHGCTTDGTNDTRMTRI